MRGTSVGPSYEACLCAFSPVANVPRVRRLARAPAGTFIETSAAPDSSLQARADIDVHFHELFPCNPLGQVRDIVVLDPAYQRPLLVDLAAARVLVELSVVADPATRVVAALSYLWENGDYLPGGFEVFHTIALHALRGGRAAQWRDLQALRER
jgi:hypothetical protein